MTVKASTQGAMQYYRHSQRCDIAQNRPRQLQRQDGQARTNFNKART